MVSMFRDLDRQTAYLLGLYTADGHCWSKSRFSISQAAPNLLLEAQKICKSHNRPNVVIEKSKTRSIYNLFCYCKEDALWIHEHGLAKGKTYFTPPPPIPDHLFMNFLAGFVDGDGHINGTSVIQIVGVDVVLSRWLCKTCNRLGICSSLDEVVRDLNRHPEMQITIHGASNMLRIYLHHRKSKLRLSEKWEKAIANLKERLVLPKRRAVYRGPRLRSSTKGGSKIGALCTICGKTVYRSATSLARYKPYCKKCVHLSWSKEATCSRCGTSFRTNINADQNTDVVCRACRNKEKEREKQKRREEKLKKNTRRCSHCGKALIRKKKNKSGIYLCQEHSKFSYMYV